MSKPMDDEMRLLVERLRAPMARSWNAVDQHGKLHHPLMLEAADAIEALSTPATSAGVRAIDNSAPAGTRVAVNGLPSPTPVLPLARYTEFNAYRADDPLAIRLAFATPEDRLAAAEAIDALARPDTDGEGK